MYLCQIVKYVTQSTTPTELQLYSEFYTMFYTLQIIFKAEN